MYVPRKQAKSIVSSQKNVTKTKTNLMVVFIPRENHKIFIVDNIDEIFLLNEF